MTLRRRNALFVVGALVVLVAGAASYVVTRTDEADDQGQTKGAVTPQRLYLLGDSYAAGAGVRPYEDASERSGCNRSTRSLVDVAAKQLDAEATNVACGGATIATMLSGERGEPSQLERLGLDADTVLVMIGGNDVNALAYVVGNVPLTQLQEDLIVLRPRLADAYRRIQQRSPTATIYAMGYPSIVPAVVTPRCPYPQQLLTLLRDGTSQLNATIAAAATDARVRAISPLDAFDGHELCTDAPWINPLDADDRDGALHPNAKGAAALGELVAGTLATER